MSTQQDEKITFAQLLAEEEEYNSLKAIKEREQLDEQYRKSYLISDWRRRNYTFSDPELDTTENILRIIGIQEVKIKCPTCDGAGLVNGHHCPTCRTNPFYRKGRGYTYLVDGKPCTHKWVFGYCSQSSRLSNTAHICEQCGYNYDTYTD